MPHKIIPLSQFLDVKKRGWKNKSCGIVSLAMVLNWWIPNFNLSCDELLDLALKENAYLKGVGWKHKELALLVKKFNLRGKNFDWFYEDNEKAFKKFLNFLKRGPVIVSIYKNFKNSEGGHLIVALKVDKSFVYFLEPKAKKREKIFQKVSIQKFKNGWKRRIIVISR
jgi:ABC-type bacteriocin/lantibiotic exporter with double-glycine peptidase domain